jgi:hypothetical protein
MTGYSGCEGLSRATCGFVASVGESVGGKSGSNVNHSRRVKSSEGQVIDFVHDSGLRGVGIENAEEYFITKGQSTQPKGEERSAISALSVLNFDISTLEKDIPSRSMGLGVLWRGMSQISEVLKDRSPCMTFADEMMIIVNGPSDRRPR